MSAQRFVAANATDALRQIKSVLGADAVVLSNREVPEGIEIVAIAAAALGQLTPNGPLSPPAPAPKTASAPYAQRQRGRSAPDRCSSAGPPATRCCADQPGDPRCAARRHARAAAAGDRQLCAGPQPLSGSGCAASRAAGQTSGSSPFSVRASRRRSLFTGGLYRCAS